MRVAALVMSSLMVFACTGESSLERPGEPGGPVNQFRSSSQQALTLPDGGQCPITVNADAELMIRNLAVVEDPLRTNWTGSLTNPSDGAWQFGRLMTTMAGPNDPELFVRNWLAQWDSPRLVNGLNVNPRPMNAIVTQPWLAASGGTRLDLTRAPFRLLAIVNRMDLRNLSRGSAGEGRFVFGVLGAGGTQLQFTVILEFNLPATTQADVDRWAADWHALGALPVGSPAYNTALEAITRRFAGPNASPSRPNGSAINQVRSNEIALSAPWEMREFNLNAAGQLVQVPVAQTTDLPLNNSPNLAQFINTNTAALLTDTHVVPATFNGAPFLAGSALTNPGHFWNAPGITNPDARFHFSVNTCNGCHAGDTNTAFLHVFPRNQGQVAQLSGFLTGTVVPDRVTGTPRTFNDLSVRSESLLAVLCAVPAAPTASVSITSPGAGATLRGPSTLSASGTGVSAVQFFVDGAPVSPPVAAPFNVPFNADTVTPGSHTLTAVGTSPTGPISAAPVAFTTAPSVAPDFTVTITSAPSLVAPGESFVTQLNVCNVGQVGGSTSVELFLSADAIITSPRVSPNDFFVGGAPVSLMAGECRAVTIQGNGQPPPGATQASVFLGAMVDSFGSVNETNEANNTSPVRTIVVGQGPDFVVTSARGPSAIAPNASFNASVTVCNRGNVTGTTEVEVMASTDTAFALPPDFLVGVVSRLTLSPSQCITSTVPAFAPPTGTWFIGAIATRGGFELVTTNNASPASRMDVGFAPDVTVSSVSAPASVLAGASFTGTTVICNNGTVDAFVQGMVVLTASRTFATPPSPNTVPVGGFTVTLTAGRCVSQAFSATATPPPGVTMPFVAVILDPNNSVPEFIETNNQLASSTAMGVGSMADLQVDGGVSAPSALLPGTAFTATVSVCNRGTIGASSQVELRLTGGGFTFPVGQAPTPFLGVNQCALVSVPGFANPPAPGLLFSLTAVVDPRNTLQEFSDANNTSAAFSMAIGSAPDFTVTSVVVPSVVAPFEPFTASVSVCNRGTAPGSSQVELVLSSDSTISLPGDQLMPGAFFTLAPNQCQTQTVQSFMNANAPPPPPGSLTTTFFIGAVADPFNSLVELRETNNTFVRSFLLGRGPDLVVTSATAPTSVVFGAPFASNVTVCNRGNASASGDISFLLSTDTAFSTSHPIGANDMLLPPSGDTFFNLAAGACATRPYTVPAFTQGGARGQMFFAVVADLGRNLPELSEANNLSPIRAITVQ
ncbi:MAG: CARDB domain-containing protein [Myxococcaceae bacterium]